LIGLADERDEDPVVVEREPMRGAETSIESPRDRLAEPKEPPPRRKLVGREWVGLGREIT
jgi:hypothetical protein